MSKDIRIKPEEVYFAVACTWIGNHNYSVFPFLILCEEKPNVKMVNEYFDQSGTYVENVQITKYNVTSDSEYELLHVWGEKCMRWENDLGKMLKNAPDGPWINEREY